MTFTSEYGEYPALDEFTHNEPALVVELDRSDLRESGRLKLVEALEKAGVDINYVTGVIVSGIVAYELDKKGGYVLKGGELARRTIPI